MREKNKERVLHRQRTRKNPEKTSQGGFRIFAKKKKKGDKETDLLGDTA